jgi:hypothetical protein
MKQTETFHYQQEIAQETDRDREGSLQATHCGKLFKKAFRIKQDSYSKLVSLFLKNQFF